MRKEQRKIQLYLSEHKDIKICEMLDRLEKESEGKRGYVPEKVKEMLKVFELIGEHLGTYDSMEILLKVVQGSTTPTVQKTVPVAPKGVAKVTPATPETPVQSSVNPLLDSFIDAEIKGFGIIE